MELGNHHTLGTVDNEGAVVGHIRYGTQENVLHNRIEVLVVGVGTVKFELCLKGHAVGQSAFETFLYGIARLINVIVNELQYKVIASISNREILSKNFVQAIVLTQFTRSIELQEIFERL